MWFGDGLCGAGGDWSKARAVIWQGTLWIDDPQVSVFFVPVGPSKCIGGLKVLWEDAMMVRFPAKRMCVCTGNAASAVELDSNGLGLSTISCSCSTVHRPGT